jgi:molybdate transport system substrate-binding protein
MAAPTTTQAPTTTTTPVSGDITVLAAASLTAAYTEIGDAFKTEHPDANVVFSFDASSALVTQINEGAPADVFASADEANMKKLTDAGGNAGEPQIFATNSLQIIVGAGNPKGITGVADLAKPDLLYVTCAPEVPIGKYAAQVLTAANVNVTPVSFEQNVKGIVTKVTAGEADAGIVYKTDVIAAGSAAEGVDIPAGINVTATYPIVAAKKAPNPAGAQAFVHFVLSDQGRQILASYGFAAP